MCVFQKGKVMQQLTHKKDAENLHVLVIASDINIIKLFRLGLHTVGYEVAGSQYGSETLDIVKRTKPELLIVEAVFPNNDVVTLLKQIRKDETIQKLFTIALIDEKSFYSKDNLNVDAIITRPFDFNDVIEQVNSFIGHLNPQLSRPAKGFLFPVDNPPPNLPERFYKNTEE